MNTETFHFQLNGRTLTVNVPFFPAVVCTDKFCPKPLLMGTAGTITDINGETKDEFLKDCRKQIIGMSASGTEESLLDTHIAGLMAVIMDHLSRHGRLLFGDLLIYMDIFSLLLEGDGYPEDEIRKAYPKVLQTITNLYPDYIFNSEDLTPFKGGPYDTILSTLQSSPTPTSI